MLVHRWRSEEQAILVGTRTALLDNPSLNVREWPGRSPLRIVIDRNLTLPKNLHLFDNSGKTIIFNALEDLQVRENRYVRLDFNRDILQQILDILYREEIQSLLVEGGRHVLQSFIDMNYWDEARVFTGIKKFGDGIPSPVIHDIDPEINKIREDVLMIYRNGV